ncbi:predicted protein [Histoplasma capsulatum G186AR]|uniref:Uncharacterized protein n=2 Tax=Ajellomyces capsulatus TaxID=5037 RepID=C0NY63_AJECG|nr:uncharacterized protein HCBG_07857 [Histoplasma capsulatum G186AR]EEH03731.1 predicted protein [Histoplasma capsulatum G186AR]KAG5293696.1 hypothetical protein I7I52_05100 [Histoplasma capsulatum]QSS75148.1 hypothetical protein I7I50_04192 [Histoplasma capsulatum G186AR]
MNGKQSPANVNGAFRIEPGQRSIPDYENLVRNSLRLLVSCNLLRHCLNYEKLFIQLSQPPLLPQNTTLKADMCIKSHLTWLLARLANKGQKSKSPSDPFSTGMEPSASLGLFWPIDYIGIFLVSFIARQLNIALEKRYRAEIR